MCIYFLFHDKFWGFSSIQLFHCSEPFSLLCQEFHTGPLASRGPQLHGPREDSPAEPSGIGASLSAACGVAFHANRAVFRTRVAPWPAGLQLYLSCLVSWKLSLEGSWCLISSWPRGPILFTMYKEKTRHQTAARCLWKGRCSAVLQELLTSRSKQRQLG